MKNVAVIFGGKSVEHDISIITGQFVMAALRATGEYAPVPIYIDKTGRWHCDEILGDLKTFQDPQFEQYLANLKPTIKHLDGEFAPEKKKGVFGTEKIKIDIAFPALHGTYGEDGTIQGILNAANVPYVGCDITASAIAMDKVITKLITAQAGIPSTPYIWFTENDWHNDRERIQRSLGQLKHPLFVKPAHLGSSIGITHVDHGDDLANAIEVALHYDNKVIVEEGVENAIEVNCAVIGNNEVEVSLVEQPLANAAFLNFDSKYLNSGKKGGTMTGAKETVKIPAPIGEKLTIEVQTIAKRAFKTIGGSGIARLDFLIDSKRDKVYLNEINPLPGSLQQHLWKASGISNIELVTRLIKLAEERFAHNSRHITTFSSSVLQQAKSGPKLGQ